MKWFKKKEICTNCNSNSTKREFEGEPTCSACKIQILLSRETTRVCPVDGATLLKEHSNDIIIDRCPKCKGVWLDAGEIEAIKQAAQTEGMAIGSIL